MHLALLLGALVAALEAGSPATSSVVTFNRDVAPLLHEHCVNCHRPSGAGPFPLMTYQQVNKRAAQIVDVTRTRFMPPWLPAAGDVRFRDERRLDEQQLQLLARWVEQGSVEGAIEDRPPLPEFPDLWQLGPPDLVVRLEQPYTLPAEGTDLFRNFVFSTAVGTRRWVEAVEIRPGSPRVVHHGVLRIDPTHASRQRDESDPETGFAGMDFAGTRAPDGHLIGWTPGKVPLAGTPGVAWRLDPGVDLVLQLHMLPSGKPEALRPEIGLHFADQPPTRHLWELTLFTSEIDIPPGERAYVVEESFALPTDVELLGVYPHAHYLGQEIRGFATLPDGSRRSLLWIRQWDFNWQEEYRYAEPLFLPAGSRVSMRFTYDNSADNLRNPNFPPRRVVYGNRSTDEMGSLTFEVLPRSAADTILLNAAYAGEMLRRNAGDWHAHNNLGIALHLSGRSEAAVVHLRRAVELQPGFVEAHYHLGIALQMQGMREAAIEEYRRVVQLQPEHVDARYNLALALHEAGRLDAAIEAYRRLLRIANDDADAHHNLANALLARGRVAEAVAHYREALRIRPDHAEARRALTRVESR